ncbi:hypothetical protein RSSM_03689 [Rhodopirellula sallentina SM41]|uniref:Uncharacterized protein n=1 Tax=Rhodopirellula sallentina SM41 TaxID=1263870 RepID=M5UAJ9_9BACT|nr:hypothetical protein RSSM_03689 [Rhodopirellula sallentina SM41]
MRHCLRVHAPRRIPNSTGVVAAVVVAAIGRSMTVDVPIRGIPARAVDDGSVRAKHSLGCVLNPAGDTSDAVFKGVLDRSGRAADRLPRPSDRIHRSLDWVSGDSLSGHGAADNQCCDARGQESFIHSCLHRGWGRSVC